MSAADKFTLAVKEAIRLGNKGDPIDYRSALIAIGRAAVELHEANNAQPAQKPTDERAAFEAWIAKDCGDLSKFGTGQNTHYKNSAVNNAWIGWKARAGIATYEAEKAQPAPEPTNERAAFENWAADQAAITSEPDCWARHRFGGDYVYQKVEMAWRAWRDGRAAGRADAQPAVPVATFQGRRLTPENTSEFWGWLRGDPSSDPPAGTLLYTAPPSAESPCQFAIDDGGNLYRRYRAPVCASCVPAAKDTDKWESARVADFNAGWNACRTSMLAAHSEKGGT